MFLARRTIGSIWIISSENLDSRLRIGIFLVIQAFALIYLSLGNYRTVSLSIIEITNCILHLVLLLMLFICVEGYMWSTILISIFLILCFPFGFIAYLISELCKNVAINRRQKLKSIMIKDPETAEEALLRLSARTLAE